MQQYRNLTTLFVLFFTLLFITGCSSATTKPIPEQHASLSPETLAPLNQQIQYFVNFPERLYPAEVDPNIVDSTYELNRALFLFAYSTSTEPATQTIYLSTTRAKSWEVFLDVSSLTFPKKLSPPFIPIGMHTNENGFLFVDLLEQFPAQEPATLVRFQTRDVGQTWEQIGCFEFSAKKYYVNDENTQKGIQPFDITELKRCKK